MYPAHSLNFMLHDFHIFGPIKKALKGYTGKLDDNMREVQHSSLGRSPKNSLQPQYADLCATRGFLSKCLWWIFLIVATPSPVSILKIVSCVHASHYVHDQIPTVPPWAHLGSMWQQGNHAATNADLCATTGFLSRCLWWIFLIVAIPSPVSILKSVSCVYASHYAHDQIQTVPPWAHLGSTRKQANHAATNVNDRDRRQQNIMSN